MTNKESSGYNDDDFFDEDCREVINILKASRIPLEPASDATKKKIIDSYVEHHYYKILWWNIKNRKWKRVFEQLAK
jgi:hypothetical protein